MGLKILLIGSITDTDGYGSCAAYIGQTLAHLGHDIRLTGNSAHGCSSDIFTFPHMLPRQKTVEQMDMVICCEPVPPYAYLQEVRSTWQPKKMGIYTMWEAQDRLPSSWAQLCQKNLDFVFVPNNFNLNQFEKDGCVIAKKLPFLISELQNHKYIDMPKKQYDKFTVVSMVNAYKYRRKLLDVLLKNWAESLGQKDDCQLILKLGKFVCDRQYIDSLLEKSKNIVALEETIDKAEVMHLFADADLVYYLTAGEGLGLPPLEANIVGTQVLFGDCNDGLEYLYESPNPRVKMVGTEKQLYWGGHNHCEKEFEFAKYSDDEIQSKLIKIYERPRSLNNKIGKQCQEWVLQNLAYENNATALNEFSQLINDAYTQPKKEKLF